MKMLQEPGFLWDLYYVFYLNFNSEEFFKPNTNKATENSLQHYKDILSQFGYVSNDLFVFFHIVSKHKSTFIHSCYLKKLENNYKKNYNVDTLQGELSDYNQVIRNIIGFYFYDLNSEELEDCINSKEILFSYIKNSCYSMEEKIKLYEFFINPIYYISLLQRTLLDKSSILYVYYKEHYKKIIEAYDYSLIQEIDDFVYSDISDGDDKEKEISFCLLDRKHFDLIRCGNECLYLLGVNYKHNEVFESDEWALTVFKNFCFTLCEETRINILLFLLKRGEATCRDLEIKFNLAASTAYHHLTIMTGNGIIITRSEGKKLLYRINGETFSQVYNFFKKVNF